MMKKLQTIISTIFIVLGATCLIALLGISDIDNIHDGIIGILSIAGIGIALIGIGLIIRNCTYIGYHIVAGFAIILTFIINLFNINSKLGIVVKRTYNRCGSYSNMYHYCLNNIMRG